jgi:hypothetical protein
MTSLQCLRLASRHKLISGPPVRSLASLSSLHTLTLVDVALDAKDLAASISSLPLRVLKLHSPLARVRLLPQSDARSQTDVSARALLELLAPLSSSLQRLEVELQPVPAQVASLTGLTKLKLLSALTDPLVLKSLTGSLTQLQSLTVKDAWPSGEDGVCLTSLTCLKTLRLNTPKLLATHLLPVLSVLARLETLELSCSVSGTIAALPPMLSLRSLSICWSSDTSLPDLTFLSLLTNLHVLRLGNGGNSHTATYVPLRSLVHLRELRLSWLPGLPLEGVRDLSCLSSLQTLSIGPVMRLDARVLALCAPLQRLRSLGVRLSWQSVAGLSALTQLKQLTMITLPTSDESDMELFALTKLAKLQLGSLGPIAPAPLPELLFKRLPNLKVLL